ncbi:AcrVA2 family anti-CRISPR protein [Pseudomonas aeruginosa]|uniref:AcrVA2 family anti-CRISPR protein n=1 Tax=Pseudomonas aeruginosa TaxID=287 RepID=UPI000F7F0747|nr:hypothetical protein [Pseudomonas aeruginosa]RTB44094.1 hypothetical protein EJ655_08115 [Pseudomonas aeruginosa]
MSTQKRTHRARRLMESVTGQYPEAWRRFEEFRRDRGKDLPDWPDWCYMPIAGGHAIASQGMSHVPLGRTAHPAILTGLASWRMTQGIFRFDDTLRTALVDTPLSGNLPTQHLLHLPHWCVYIETGGLMWGNAYLHGFFAYLEYDLARGGVPELRLLLDAGGDPRQPFAPGVLQPIALILNAPNLQEAVDQVVDSGKAQFKTLGIPAGLLPDLQAVETVSLAPLISLLLYLCADPDITRRGTPVAVENPRLTRTRRDGVKLFPASEPADFDVGVRLGAALRRAQQRRSEGAADVVETSRRVAPHVRGQHWHSYWSGPKITEDGSPIPLHERKLDIRWMPPIPVNVDDVDDLQSTIRPVRR